MRFRERQGNMTCYALKKHISFSRMLAIGRKNFMMTIVIHMTYPSVTQCTGVEIVLPIYLGVVGNKLPTRF